MDEIEEMRRYFGITENFSYEDLLLATYQSSGAASHLKGVSAEQHFRKKVEDELGGLTEKIGDHKVALRFDYHVMANDNLRRVEVKVLLSSGSLSVGYRDYRDVLLPSGETWRTKARQFSEEFDLLAICLVNHTGSFDDFLYIKSSDLPHYYIDRKEESFADEDKAWITKNYYSKSVTVNPVAASPYTSNLMEVLK